MKKFILALAALTLSVPAFAAVSNPPPLDPTKSVVDAANILTPDEEAQVEAQSRRIYDTTHHHIVVLTMPTLNGAPVQDYIHNAFQFYKLGNRQRNDGVLLLISMKDPKRLQIEVGDGLQGVLTDAISPQITDRMKPLMKSGDYLGGITQGVDDIAQVISKEQVTPQQLAATKGNTPTALERADSQDAFLNVLLVLGIIGGAVAVFYYFIIAPKRRAAEKAKARIIVLMDNADSQRYRGNLDRSEALYKEVLELDANHAGATEGLDKIKTDREVAAHQAEQARIRAAEEKANPKPRIIERVREVVTPKREPSFMPPAPPKRSTPKPAPTPSKSSDDDAHARNMAIALETQRREDARRRQERDDEDRRRRDREDEERRQRDSWSSSSSSSSSYDWGSSSSSSSYDSGSSSYDSGGSSSGGGGGSDW